MRKLPPLNRIRFFEEVARHRSFNRAAEALNVTQGAVSRQIKHLEEYLGVVLFSRGSRGLTLTDAGNALIPHLTEAFDRIERALEAVRVPDLRQRLRILAPPTWSTRWLSPRLPEFTSLYPDIRLSITNHRDEEHPGELDCRILFSREGNSTGNRRLLVMERHIAVASPELFQDGHAPCLRDHPLLHILHEGHRLPVWENWLTAAGRDDVDADSGIEFGTLDQAIHTALAGGGLAVIDRQMIEHELASGSLLPITPMEVIGPYGYWLEVPGNKSGLSKIERFADWLAVVSNP